MRGATPKAKTLNVKVLSHDKSLIANDFSCNRGNPDEVRVAGGYRARSLELERIRLRVRRSERLRRDMEARRVCRGEFEAAENTIRDNKRNRP
jgi:hypothetical protein